MAEKPNDQGKAVAPPKWLGPAKVAVVVMGLMIVVGVAIIVATLIERSGLAGSDAETANPPTLNKTAVIKQFGDLTVPIPADHRLESVTPDGGYLYAHLRSATGDSVIVVIWLETGATLGRVIFAPDRN